MLALPTVVFERRIYLATLPTFGLVDSVGPEHAAVLNTYLQTLVLFRALSLQARQEWVENISWGANANNVFSRRPRSFSDLVGRPNKTEAHTNNLIQACSMLNMAKQGAFDFAIDEDGVNKSIYVSHWPWCLTDQEFASCKAALDNNEMPTLNTGKARDWLDYTEKWGGFLVAGGTVAAGLTAGVFIGSGVIVAGGILKGFDSMMLSILQARYARDENRRKLIRPA